MTRKDYVLAASIVASIRKVDAAVDASKEAEADAVENAFAEFFRRSGGSFDEGRFRAACK